MPGQEWLHAAGVVAIWATGAAVIGWLSGVLVNWLGHHGDHRLLVLLHQRCHYPWVTLLLVWAVYTAMPEVNDVTAAIRHVLLLVLIGAAAWLVVRLLYVVEDLAFTSLRIDVANNRRNRRVRTQVAVLRRLTSAAVTVIALSTMLMTFEPLRAFGASLLASAGVAGAVAGLAAQTTLRNVLAGLQLALTDQLRLDDVIVVEGEWGRVEELTLTRVVVRLWDERRLVLPTTYFVTNPFQNWTRNESRVLGAVLLHLDYRAPVRELRAEARRIVENSPLWDRRDWVLQVVDSTPWSMVIRVLASAADGPSSWDLRCEIREQLIAFLRTEYPQALPRSGAAPVSMLRPVLDPASGPGAGPGTGPVAGPGVDGLTVVTFPSRPRAGRGIAATD
ncbi:mechanosensitive ion channel family protein [Pseudonocardia acidicola]|uniref:Mechanosensitive ion channel family protein n=1 Tax=Pseudonocardia acidicola TaxID=2724939 RepID=A0ABX1SCK1_9PSEU|nr:mechanosensitive ion channel family protein [Pseudonocardia acidicola]NMH99290.1 mechanosensitive ion channel family protein [Pseudonocardia acidicola]